MLLQFRRFSDYRQNSFITEHNKIIEKVGYVWMLKIGRQIPEVRLNELFKHSGMIILKASKQAGGQYYAASVKKAVNGKPNTKMPHPSYYEEMESDENYWNLPTLEGTWFCLTEIRPINENVVAKLKLVSNDKSVEEVLSHTRSSVVYVYSAEPYYEL